MSQLKQTLEDERHEQATTASEHNNEIAELRRQVERTEQRAAVADRMKDEIEELREKEAQLVRKSAVHHPHLIVPVVFLIDARALRVTWFW
jgi:hypothetical protein